MRVAVGTILILALCCLFYQAKAAAEAEESKKDLETSASGYYGYYGYPYRYDHGYHHGYYGYPYHHGYPYNGYGHYGRFPYFY